MALQIRTHCQQKRHVLFAFFATICKQSSLLNFTCFLLGLLFTSHTHALPSEPRSVTVFQVSCAHQCDADTIRQGLADLKDKQVVVGEKELNVLPRSCPADRRGKEELTNYEKLLIRWPGLRIMALPDNAPAKLYIYECGAKNYFLIDFQRIRNSLGNPPKNQSVVKVENSMKEFVYEKVKIHRQPDHGGTQAS